MDPDTSLIPTGSLTKAITGVAVMQEIEKGRLGFDTPAYQIVDVALSRLHNTTMLQLWNSPLINSVTVEDLLGMVRRGHFTLPRCPILPQC
jgi:CubicO group peptidase (beta-lactamase class C family)